jgi:ubiquinone/menaquinone biosynthesis C-methylase UbiE
VDEMLKFGKVKSTPLKVLDVGCGIGGTSRYLAKKFGTQTEVTGITLSPQQQARATQLAKDQGVPNAKFEVMDALEMKFPDNSFDLVWVSKKTTFSTSYISVVALSHFILFAFFPGHVYCLYEVKCVPGSMMYSILSD